MLGASQVVLLGQAAAQGVVYDTLVASFGADVVSYWKFQNDGTDERGTENAIITGSPELNVDTIVDLDSIADGAPTDGACIAWPGIGGVYAQAAHNPAHKTAQGTIVVTFQVDALAEKSTLIAADANAAAGGLSVEVQTNGAIRAFLRRQSDGAPVLLATGPAGDVQPSEAYTLIFKWGPGGLSLALWNEDGLQVRRLSDPAGDGVTGTSPIRFGAWHTDVSHHDGPYGRVVWLKRRISDAEETVIARPRTIARAVASLALIGAWPFSEPSGLNFDDAVGGNTAVLAVPSWTIATHRHNRRGIVAGTDHALEVSNGGPAIPMVAAYKKSAMSLVIYAEPRGELRGTQYWVESDERYGREFIAYCDDGTVGSFAIYRKRIPGVISSNRTWRLGGYVRTASGKQYFGGSQAGTATTSLPVDTAKRIVLTQGPAGAELWLDDTKVATLSATDGWSGLTSAIQLGSSSDTGHANDRSPFWGRIDQVEVWEGQIDPTTGAGSRPAAVQSLLWKLPVSASLLHDTTPYASNQLQQAVDDAAAAGKFLYQPTTDTKVFIATQIAFKPNCRGFIGVQVGYPNNMGGTTSSTGGRLILMDVRSVTGGAMQGHNDRWAADGGWRFIGCRFDGNGRNVPWASYKDSGVANTGFDREHNPAFYMLSNAASGAGQMHVLFDACDFLDFTGDALSTYDGAQATAESCRFYGIYRGPFVINGRAQVTLIGKRCESFMASRVEATQWWNGGGVCDLEPFTVTNADPHLTPRWTRFEIYDYWAEADFDDHNSDQNENDPANPQSWSKYHNLHVVCAGMSLRTTLTDDRGPIQIWYAKYSTLSYYRRAYAASPGTNFPAMDMAGAVDGPDGRLFEDTVFLANGREYLQHEFGQARPETSDTGTCGIRMFNETGDGNRLITLRRCQVRPLRLNPSQPVSNRSFILFDPTSASIQVEDLIIDAAFKTGCCPMSGGTVRHRNVVHEGGGSISQIFPGASTYTPI